MKILVIGAGIAGCALGLALSKAGIACKLVDLKPAPTAAGGAFLTLAPNGIKALRSLGLESLLEGAGGFEQSGLEFFNANGRKIAAIKGENDLSVYGACGVVMRRARLQEVLEAAALKAEIPIEYGRQVKSVSETGDGVKVAFDDGSSEQADIVIGADGIWSQVRRATWPQAPNPLYTGIVDCGGWAEVDIPDTTRQQMHFGRRAFFGYTVKDKTAYWFTNIPEAIAPERGELEKIAPEVWLTKVRELNRDAVEPVRHILAMADSAIGAWPLYNMPPLPTWHTRRVCLIGDAAHAVSPSTGQGASLAIEDAAVLAMCLRDSVEPQTAFERYLDVRKARAESIVEFGRQIGDRKVASTVGSWFRDLTLAFFLRMGRSATKEQYSYQIDWNANMAQERLQ